MPNTFTLTGTVNDINNNPAYVGRYVKFRVTGCGTDTDTSLTYPRYTKSFIIQSDGTLAPEESGDTMELWVNGDSGVQSYYRIRMPRGEVFDCVIPSAADGTTVDLSTIIESYQVNASTSQNTTLEDAKAYTDVLADDPTNNNSFIAANWQAGLGISDFTSLTPTDESVIKGNGSGFVTATYFRVDAGTSGNSTEMGTGTANGSYSTACGFGTIASGDQSFASGVSTTASGDYSHATGFLTTASGSASTAHGNSAIASGTSSYAAGGGAIASGNSSHAEGNADATGDYSHAEGFNSTASGTSAHSEGSSTTASGEASHAQGAGTTASGNYSHAEGLSSTASGDYSSATGRRAKAIHDGARVEADSQNADVSSTTTDQYTARFQNGYVIEEGTIKAKDGIELGTGETVNDIAATLSDSDTELPTSGAVVDYAQPISLADAWTFSDNTTASDPGSGGFKLDNATQASATNIYISDTSLSGEIKDFGNLSVGEQFRVTDTSLNSILFELSGSPVDNTGWHTIPVTVVSNTGSLSNNTRCVFRQSFWASASGIEFDQLALNTSAVAGAYTEGVMRWNDTDKAIEYDTGVDSVTLQIGQENLMRVRNATGSTITNGSVVRVSGATGNRPNAVLAQADTADNAMGTIGIATHDIENNTDGFITTQGLVRGFDTSSFSEGDVVYLSDTVAGGLDTTEPNIAVKMGIITTSNVSNGAVAVNIETTIPVFGSIYVDSGSTAQSIASGASYTKSTAFSTDGTDGNDSGGIADAANDKLILSRGVWHVTASISFSSGSSNINVFGSLFLDGVEQNNLHFQRKVGTGSDVGSASIVGLVTVDQDTEDLDLRLRHDDAGADNITIVYANMNGHKVSI